MSCLDLESGYLAIGCTNCQVEVFNNALTAQFIDRAQAACRDTPGTFLGQQPCCVNKLRPSQIGSQCDSWAPDIDADYPGAILGDGSRAAWWYDDAQPGLTGGVLGFIIKRHTLGTADTFEGDIRDVLRRRPRLYRRGIRMGVIEGSIIANNSGSAQYGIEALRNLVVTSQLTCPCNTRQMSVYRFCCDPDDGLTGEREVYDVGGFDLQVSDDLTDNSCSGICNFTLTYEVGNPVLYAVDQTVIGDVTTSPECLCDTGCPDVTEYEEIEIRNYTSKNTRSIRLLYDQGTEEKLACPVDFLSWDDYDPTTDVLVVTGIEGKDAVPVGAEDPECKPYRIKVFVDELGDITWEPVMPTRWPTNGSLPCDDCDIIVSSVSFPNPNFNPYCEGCPSLAIECAADNGLTISDSGFIIIEAPTRTGTDFYTYSGGSTENEWVNRYLDYIECTTGKSASDVLSCDPVFPADPIVGVQVRLAANGAVSFQAVSAGGVANCAVGSCQISSLDHPGANVLVGSTASMAGVGTGCDFDEVSIGVNPVVEGRTVDCQGNDISEYCSPFKVIEIDSAIDPTGAEYIDVTLTGSGYAGGGEVNLTNPAQWPNPEDGLPDFTQIVITGCSGSIPVVTPDPATTQTLADLCAPPIPEDACVNVTITGDTATWSESGWVVGQLWPYDYAPEQFAVCNQDASPIIDITMERRPIALGCRDTGPCASSVIKRSVSDVSCWDLLCDPIEFRAHEVAFGSTNRNIRYAGILNIVNRTGSELTKISVDWYLATPDQPAPSTDWQYWHCSQVPMATQRITYLSAGDTFRIDNSGSAIFCSGRWEDGIGRLDATHLALPEFLGSGGDNLIYCVVRHECCDGHGDVEVVGSLIAIESL